MDDKKRLEDIRYNFDAYRELSESEEEWLIEQVEKVEELQKEINRLKHEKIIFRDRSIHYLGELINKTPNTRMKERYEQDLYLLSKTK